MPSLFGRLGGKLRSGLRRGAAGDRRRCDVPGSANDRVTIEYTPDLDGDPDPGEVVWITVPYEDDPRRGKDRPLVVVGRRNHQLMGIPLTTKRHRREPQLEVGSGAWDSQGRVSYAKLDQMQAIDPAKMRREGAVLDRRRFDALVDAVDRYYDVAR